MKDVIRGGHSLDVRGASGIVDEVTEDRKITAKVIEYLRLEGNEVLDATPSNSGTSIVDLSVPVNKANSWGADYFASIHLNAGGGHGVEVLYKSAKGKEYAERIVNKIAELGFTNRGAKADVRGLYEFNHVIAPNNIIEVFFCDSQTDVDLYNKLGIDVIAKAIAEGIVGHEIKIQQPNKSIQNTIIKEEVKVKNLVVYGNSIDRRASEYLADYLQCPTLDGNIPYDYSNIENVVCVGGKPKDLDWTSYAKKIITGTDRYDTMIQVLKYINKL
jgi:N-acetylmuramoyl-L-alanine amidase